MSLSWKYGDVVDFTALDEPLQQQGQGLLCLSNHKYWAHKAGKIWDEDEERIQRNRKQSSWDKPRGKNKSVKAQGKPVHGIKCVL